MHFLIMYMNYQRSPMTGAFFHEAPTYRAEFETAVAQITAMLANSVQLVSF